MRIKYTHVSYCVEIHIPINSKSIEDHFYFQSFPGSVIFFKCTAQLMDSQASVYSSNVLCRSTFQ